VFEELAGDGTCRHARRCLTRTGAFEDVAHVGAAVLRNAGEIRVSRSWPRDRRATRAAGIRRWLG
jgi:hypothetical protein